MDKSRFFEYLKYGAIIIIIIFSFIELKDFLYPDSNQFSKFKGNAEYIDFTGQNSHVQFKAKGIYIYTNEVIFYSVKNIRIESNKGEMKLNNSVSLDIQYNENQSQHLSNIDADIFFDNLTMNKGLVNNINFNGNQSSLNFNSNDKEAIIILRPWVKNVDIDGQKFADFDRISFEIDNTSSVKQLFSEKLKLEAYDISDLKITSQLSKIILYQGEGIFGLNNHIFDVKSPDVLEVEIFPVNSLLTVEETKLSFTGYAKSAKLNDKDMIIGDISYWFEVQPEKINAIAVVISVFLTALASISTWRLVSMEADKKKHEKQRFLNILLAEFETNSILLKDLKNSAETIIKDPSKVIEFAFFGFKEDGFNTFRNQGGFEYINITLYNKIADYYTSLYRLATKNKLKLSIETNQLGQVIYHATKGTLMKDIENIEESTNSLKNELKNEMQKT
jgi:hypothetical protein